MTLATMPSTESMPELFSGGEQLDPEYLGTLKNSTDIADDTEALRARLTDEGYLYLPGYLDRQEVLAARRFVTDSLAAKGCFRPGADSFDAEMDPDAKVNWNFAEAADARNCPPIYRVLYSGRMVEFFTRFLGGPIRHFDYTWFRTVVPGKGTPSHCDIVYMGRGTPRLYTAWVPYGDVDFNLGGLMVLENSHKIKRLRDTYGKSDVDSYCLNKKGPASKSRGIGHLGKNPNQIRKSLGGRWLTTEFRAGDLLLFSMFLVHGSLANRTNRMRISSDSRYQLASEPADERWIGPNPSGHSEAGKRGRVC